MKIDSLNKLLTDELRDLYNAEHQMLKALPKMSKAATAPELKDVLQEHLRVTEKQVARLEHVFELLGASPKGKTCKAMAGLVEEGEELIKDSGIEASLKDAGLIIRAQKVEHYEIAGYGSVRTLASVLGLTEIADLLEQTLEEEKDADQTLTDLAERIINVQAAQT